MEENISKALLIAAGVFISIMLVSLLVLGYNEISDYYNEQSEAKRREQLSEFNKEFQNFNRDDLRGTDLISLINKVLDYNARQVYADGTGYERLEMTIDMKSKELINQFFKYNPSDDTFIETKITNKINVGAEQEKDRLLLKISETETVLIEEAKDAGINKLTSAKLQKLSSNISNIVLDEVSEKDEIDREKRENLLQKVLGSEFNKKNTSQLEKIKEITSQYYQYTQFKRAHFTCEDMIFDPGTGRITEIKIKIMTKTNEMTGEDVVVFN